MLIIPLVNAHSVPTVKVQVKLYSKSHRERDVDIILRQVPTGRKPWCICRRHQITRQVKRTSKSTSISGEKILSRDMSFSQEGGHIIP